MSKRGGGSGELSAPLVKLLDRFDPKILKSPKIPLTTSPPYTSLTSLHLVPRPYPSRSPSPKPSSRMAQCDRKFDRGAFIFFIARLCIEFFMDALNTSLPWVCPVATSEVEDIEYSRVKGKIAMKTSTAILFLITIFCSTGLAKISKNILIPQRLNNVTNFYFTKHWPSNASSVILRRSQNVTTPKVSNAR